MKQEYETRTLPPIELRQFSGYPVDWPEFIENFRSRVHLKTTFDDNLRMERLCSVLDGEAKRVIEAIGKSGRFYATALKTLKRDFGNPVLVSHAKLKLLFDQPQIKGADRMSLRRFHQHLKINNTWLLSMSYDTPILSKENLTKAILRLPTFLRREFFKTTGDSNMLDGSANLNTLEKWLNEKLKSVFNPLADVILNEEEKLKDIEKAPFKSRTINTLQNETTKDNKTENNEVDKIMARNPDKVNTGIKCWLFKKEHRLKNCESFLAKVLLRKKIL